MTNKVESVDVIIIGGGPAGISAAIWCAELQLSAILFECSKELGGQLTKINAPIINYPGIVTENGREMSQRFSESLDRFETAIRSNEKIVNIDPAMMAVTSESGITYKSKVIVIATGVRRRTLEIPGELELVGRGILDSGVGSKDRLKGKDVLIVGGGDAAFENAVILSEVASQVTLVHRRSGFSAREEFVETARARSNVKIIAPARIVSINGVDAVESVTLQEHSSTTESTIPVDAVLIRVGVVPNSDILDTRISLDADGYVIVDRTCRTSCPRIFAVGDVSNKTAPTIASSVGDGATAIKTAYSLLKAS